MPTPTKAIPKRIDTPSAWRGSDLTSQPDRWLVHLTQAQVAELEAAAETFLAKDSNIGAITAEKFPLPTLAPQFSNLRETLLHGFGFQVIRGLPADRYDQKTAATIFCGIGAHLGSARSQNAMGHILGHIRDIGWDPTDPNARIYQTSARQTFHTDSADVVALLYLKDAKQGGESLLVSTETLYNEMMQRRADLVPLLFEPIATDRRGEIPPGEQPFMTIPVLNWHGGKLTGFYQRQYIDSAQRFPDAMRLTPKHIEALDLFDELANDPALHLSMRLEPGDLQFVYNHPLLHDRTGFTDWPDPKDRRHLLRLWLSIPGDRPLPECFRQRYGSIKIGDRGGIICEGTELHVPLN